MVTDEHDAERQETKKRKTYNRNINLREECAERLQSFLPLALAQLLNLCRYKVCQSLSEVKTRIPYETKLTATEIRSWRTESPGTMNIFEFRYPGHGHYYTALSAAFFCKSVCAWTGVVRDWHILYSPPKWSIPVSFSYNETLLMMLEHDEKDENETKNEQPHMNMVIILKSQLPKHFKSDWWKP